MHCFPNHSPRSWPRSRWCSLVVACGLLLRSGADLWAVSDLVEPVSVAGLTIQKADGKAILTWPSHPRESFVVLWRPEVSVYARWIELTNQLRASASTNQTVFCDQAAFTRGPAMLTNVNLAGFYRVFLIPDFWFDMNGVELRGSTNCGEDFLPFFNGSKETWDLFKPQATLVVDGEPSSAADEGVERINFRSQKRPYWAYSRGLWFQHDTLRNGEHALQLSTLLTLNTIVGDASQFLTLTNRPVRVRVNNEISYEDWLPFIQGDTYTFVARSATPRVNWRIDVYDKQERLIASKTGRTTNGEIRWTWNLRDKQGRSRDDFDSDQSFRSALTTWPVSEPAKGSQGLLEKRDEGTPSVWWSERLGRDFVRKPPSEEESRRRFIFMEPHPMETNALTRPLELPRSNSQQ